MSDAVESNVVRLLTLAETEDQIYDGLLPAIGEGIDWDAGAHWMLDDQLVHRTRATWHGPRGVRPEYETAAREAVIRPAGVAAWIRQTNAHDDTLRTALAFPIMSNENELGVVELVTEKDLPADPELLAALAGIGRRVGEAVGRLRAIAELRETAARHAQIIDSAEDCVVSIDSAGRILDFNVAAERTFGYLRAEVMGKDASSLILPLALRNPGPADRRSEITAQRKDGTEFPIEISVVPIPPGSTSCTAFIRDITERKAAERRLRESEGMLAKAQSIAHIGSWVSGVRENDPIDWSKEIYRMFGVSEGEPISVARFFDMVHPDDRERVRTASRLAFTGGKPYDIVHRICRTDGAIRIVHEHASVFPDERGQPARMVGTVQDVTDRARVEERDRFLADANVRFASAFELSAILDTVVRTAVPHLGSGCLVEIFDVAQWERYTAAAHQSSEIEAIARRALADGHPISCSSDVPAQLTPDLLDMLEATSHVCVPLRARGRVFGAIAFLRGSPHPAYDALEMSTAADYTRLAGLAIDNARLYHDAQKSIRARDDFLSLAAHELKTPLTPLRIQTAGLLRAIGGDRTLSREDLARRVETIDRATLRLEHFIETLLDVSELTVGHLDLSPTDVDLSELASTMIERLSLPLERAGCNVVLRAPVPVVGRWDGARLARVLDHLMSNAMKYGAGRPIEIEVESHSDVATISVRDFGIGISPEDQTRIFDRFERRVPVQNFGGFGLGLWVVRELVEAHGGKVRMFSTPGTGSQVQIELPRQPSLARRQEKSAS